VKSGCSEGLLGDVMFDDVVVVFWSNCEVRSESWDFRRGSWEDIALGGVSEAGGIEGWWTYSSDVSSTWDWRDSMPERNCSSDREI
jgi:hypothetical protein